MLVCPLPGWRNSQSLGWAFDRLIDGAEVMTIHHELIPGLEHVDLWESYLLDLVMDEQHGTLRLTIDFVLLQGHPKYHAPLLNEAMCFERGNLLFLEVKKFEWIEEDMIGSTDATGEVDYGSFSILDKDGDAYRVGGEFGIFIVDCSHVDVVI